MFFGTPWLGHFPRLKRGFSGIEESASDFTFSLEVRNYNKGLMKKLVFLMAALAIVGCTKQGGTEDQYDSTTGSSRTNNTYRATPDSSPSSTVTNSSSSSSTNTPSLPQ